MFSTNSMRLAQSKIRRKKNVKKGIQFCLMVCGASGTGKTINSVLIGYQTHFSQVEPHSSTPSVAREFFSPKMPTTQPMPTWRKESGLNLSQSVGGRENRHDLVARAV
jgi:septin family protein